jgi:hypothetical protein
MAKETAKMECPECGVLSLPGIELHAIGCSLHRAESCGVCTGERPEELTEPELQALHHSASE